MAEFIYVLQKARKAHGDKVILDDVTLAFLPGAKIGVVGPNGMGKSTLLKIMAGLEEVSNGEARLTPGFTVGLLQQEPPLDEDATVRENVEQAFAETLAKVARFNEISTEMADPDADFDALMDEMGKLQDAIDAANGWDLDSQLSQAMDALQCPDPDAPVSVLSGGERRRVALCRLLLEAPDLLLLDEPTNHLDAESGSGHCSASMACDSCESRSQPLAASMASCSLPISSMSASKSASGWAISAEISLKRFTLAMTSAKAASTFSFTVASSSSGGSCCRSPTV